MADGKWERGCTLRTNLENESRSNTVTSWRSRNENSVNSISEPGAHPELSYNNQRGLSAHRGSSRGYQEATDYDDNQSRSHSYRGSSRGHQQSSEFSGQQRVSQAHRGGFRESSTHFENPQRGPIDRDGGGNSGRRDFRLGDRGRVENKRNESWNFWTLLCGAQDSEVVFTDFKGDCQSAYLKEKIDNGWKKVPLFQEATKESIRMRFGDKLRSIASSIAECKELNDENWRLRAHLRIGDLFLSHRSFHFERRPGPKLKDLNLLLEDNSFPSARDQLSNFFSRFDTGHFMTSTFVTEKSCGSHSTIEAFLNLNGFEIQPNDEYVFTATLDGENNKFELYYNLRDLKLEKVDMFTHKWNLNLVTAKGTSYQGIFREKADFRLQLDAAVSSDTEDSLEKVKEHLRDNDFDFDELQQLFERIDYQPDTSSASGTAEWFLNDCERSYRIRQPNLATKLTYLREQHNKKFTQSHERWPLVVMLRQFRFFSDPDPATGLFSSKPGLQLRACAELDCQLDQQALMEPEFVSYMWDACQLVQDLVATSLEA